jgi:hypothetical protein
VPEELGAVPNYGLAFPRYGPVFGSSEIELVKDSIVKVPLKYILMV